MVYLHHPKEYTLRLNAYVTVDLSRAELDAIHNDFEGGAGAKYRPIVEIYIKDVKEYRTMAIPDIRRAETAAGRTDAFLLIDDNATKHKALWYIDRFANEEEVEWENVESVDVVLKILMRTMDIPLAHVNLNPRDGDGDIFEFLEEAGAQLPLTNDLVQERPYASSFDAESVEYQSRSYGAGLYLEPGEFEITSAEEVLSHWPPQVKRLARMTEEVAEATGLRREWAIVNAAADQPVDGAGPFAEGSIVIQGRFVDARALPPYQRLEGSL